MTYYLGAVSQFRSLNFVLNVQWKINYIYSNILSCKKIEKNLSGHMGTRTCVAGLSQQACSALDHLGSPKKDASSPE